jgi:hypothetical protein
MESGMTLFELTFALSAVILGLALTQIVSSLHRLMLAGRRVHWAPEPILLCALIFMVTVTVWLQHWDYRHQTTTTIGLVMLLVMPLLLLFLAAAFVLPEHPPKDGEIDLLAHYNRTRPFAFGALILSMLLFRLYDALFATEANGFSGWWRLIGHDLWPVAVFAVLIPIRARWFNIALLIVLVGMFAWKVIPIPLTQ